MSDCKLKYLIILCSLITIHGFRSLSSSKPSPLSASVCSKNIQCKLKLNQRRYQMMIHHNQNDIKYKGK